MATIFTDIYGEAADLESKFYKEQHPASHPQDEDLI